MGILSWWKGNTTTNTTDPNHQKQQQQLDFSTTTTAPPKPELPGMNGAVEVTRATKPEGEEVTVFEFGSVAASADKVTLAGFCPVSDDLQPCLWQILPATDHNAPQFRVVF